MKLMDFSEGIGKAIKFFSNSRLKNAVVVNDLNLI